VVEKTREILLRAIACGGSSISDFVNSSGQKGYFQLELTVYGRAGQGCTRCPATIARLVIGGRSTSFVPTAK
jgi:formamidopyrimidine-DNA glycosylase